jgi:integrase
MALSMGSRGGGDAIVSLADLMREISSDPSLSPRQRQDTGSALRVVGRVLARPLEEIPAQPGQLRERLATMTPAMAGVSKGRWANILSLTRAALARAGLSKVPGRSSEPLTPEWQDLFRHLNHRRMREGLSRFARHCSAQGIAPGEVCDAVADMFLTAVAEEALLRNPRQIHRTMCITWNRAAALIADWPPTRLTVPQYRDSYSLPWESFPASLRTELEAYFDRLSGKDLLAELDFQPLRPASIRTYRTLFRAYVSALVHRGRAPAGLQSLADVVVVDTVKEGLRFFLDRAGGRPTKQSYNVARMLTAMARHWVKADAAHLEQLRGICRRLEPDKSGLSDKNRQRLRQFDDPQNVGALLTLPPRIHTRQSRRSTHTVRDALDVQSALAVELLLMVPMRIGNLASLNLDQNILRTRSRGKGVVHLFVPAEEVKNGMAIEAELPTETVSLLDFYIDQFRPLLLPQPSSALFPSSTGGAKSRHTLALQIQKFLLRECGLRINVHLFRHFAAKLYLEDHPGAYGLIRLVHGHASAETTSRYYCGTETAAAMRHFDEHVLRLRAQLLPAGVRRSSRRRRRHERRS